jgi:hypothetical protein
MPSLTNALLEWTGLLSAVAELLKDRGAVLPISVAQPHYGTVTGVGIRIEGIEGIEGIDRAGAERIEMNVTDKLEEVGLLLAEDGFVAILEEMAGSFVAFVERDGIARKKTPHHPGHWCPSGAEKKVGVI